MRRSVLAAVLALVALSCAERKQPPASRADLSEPHAATHVLFPPEQISFKPGPASLPPGAQVAVLEGDPTKAGFFAMRLKFPDGYRVPPHWHPGVERVTVVAGTLHLGRGDTFDPAATQALPAGSYSSMQPGMRHFAWVKGETVLQLSTQGPWDIVYVNPADDPRKQPKQ